MLHLAAYTHPTLFRVRLIDFWNAIVCIVIGECNSTKLFNLVWRIYIRAITGEKVGFLPGSTQPEFGRNIGASAIMGQ